MDEGVGCIGAIILMALFGWVPLHFSGKSILVYRTEQATTVLTEFKATEVACHYVNSTGIEKTVSVWANPSAYYCPRYKDVGN